MLHLLVSAAVVLAVPQSTELRREALMDALRGGGYTVVLRHARTDRSFQEARHYVPKTRAEQRNLNDDGIRDAALMGVVFRKHDIRFAEIISSPMYRCVETAEMAAGNPTALTMDLRVIPSTPEQAALIAKAPKAGTNRLLVTHHFVIETHVPGIRPGEIGESEAVVVRTVGGKVELVGRITLDDWRRLANPGASASESAPAAASHATHPTSTPNSQPPTPNSFPDTHAGHMAQLYLEAFNSGSRETMKNFLESSMKPNPDRPMDDRLATYERLYQEYGKLTLHAVEKSESTEAVLGVQSSKGPIRMTVVTLPAEPMKLSSVTFAMFQGSHP
jgi:phosphohistidine phosphatase SixA